jgi:selenocysteine lyase/cysteine desulfurase
LVHYNTAEEIARLLRSLSQIMAEG